MSSSKIKKTKEQILDSYKKEAEKIIDQMLAVLLRAQLKIDDAAYRKALENYDNKPI